MLTKTLHATALSTVAIDDTWIVTLNPTTYGMLPIYIILMVHLELSDTWLSSKPFTTMGQRDIVTPKTVNVRATIK